jgi:hypothetical protein
VASYSPVRAGSRDRSGLESARRSRAAVEATPLARALRIGGAVALLAMGALHLQQYLGAGYSEIPTIGTLFMLNFAAALVVSLGLLMPLERLLPRRGTAVVSLLALGGTVMAAAAIVFLLISESTPLFGFMEDGYRMPIVVALIAEGLAVILLGAFLVTHLRRLRGAAGGVRAGSSPRAEEIA